MAGALGREGRRRALLGAEDPAGASGAGSVRRERRET